MPSWLIEIIEGTFTNKLTVFEDKKLADEAVKATEKVLAHHDEDTAAKITVTEKLDTKT